MDSRQREANSVTDGSAKQQSAVVGYISSAMVGAVALAAIAGASEYKISFAAVAVAFFVIGPVAYGGLVFAAKQLMAFFTSVKDPEPAAIAAVAASAASEKLRRSVEHAVQPEAKNDERLENESEGSCGDALVLPVPTEKQGLQATDACSKIGAIEEKEEYVPTAADLMKDVWAGVPSFNRVVEMTVSAVRGTPDFIGKLPSNFSELCAWLNSPHWRPFPWNYLPDPVAFTWGLLVVLFMAPIWSVEILVAVPAMELLKAEWRQKRFAWGRKIVPEFVRSISQPIARMVMRDVRNHSYLPWLFYGGVIVPVLFAWALGRHLTHGLEFSTLCIYHLLRVGPRLQIFAHLHTLVHKECHAHRGFFKGIWAIFNCVTEWWAGPFFGVVPWNYYIAHMKIHHRWHNDVDDVHTNLDLDRTNPLSFFLYVPRFTLYWTGISPLALLIKRQEWLLTYKLLAGMVYYYGLTLVMLWWQPTFCLTYWLFPHVESCVLLCAISYLWHAFVEESDPGNQYVNAVTILEGRDNVWNEDYHVVHHHAPNVHWTDAPAHFEKYRAEYAAVTATVFQKTEEGELLQWMFGRNWRKMAEHFVDLNGKMTVEEKRALLIRRLSMVCGKEGRDGKRKDWALTSTIREYDQ